MPKSESLSNEQDQPTSDPATDPADGSHPPLRHTLQVLWRASRGFWLVNWVNFGDGIAYFGVLALLTLFLEQNVGFTAHWSTVGVSVFMGLVTLFMAIGGGTLTDKLGARRALALSMAVVLGGRILMALSPTLGSAAMVGSVAWISLVVMGFGEGVLQPALYAGVKQYTDARTATMGYAFLYSIMNLGIVAGELVSPAIREGYARRVEGLEVSEHPAAGISGAMWFFILVTALVLIVHLVLFSRRVEERDRVIEPTKPTESLSGPRTLVAKLRALPILDYRFVFFISILLPVRTLFAHQYLTMPHFVTRAFPPEVGSRWEWLSGLNPLIIVIAVPVLAALTRRRHVVDMMIVGTLVSAGATWLLVGEANLPMLITYFIVFALGEALWSSRFLEYIADIAPAARVGIYMGIAGLPWFLAKTVTGFYAGSMLDLFVPAQGPQSPGTMWAIYGLIALISPLGLMLARRWLLEGEERGRGGN